MEISITLVVVIVVGSLIIVGWTTRNAILQARIGNLGSAIFWGVAAIAYAGIAVFWARL